jgi:5-methylcytosine-specific restriction endonuclease McrA
MKKLIPLLLLCPPLMAAELNPNVTQDNIKQTVCVKGWTSTVRPPVSYTNRIKHNLLPKGRSVQEYELDHIVSLSCGGAPKSIDNLWLQPWKGEHGALAKDKLERQLHKEVCNGKITLSECQKIFISGWEKEYDKRFIKNEIYYGDKKKISR